MGQDGDSIGLLDMIRSAFGTFNDFASSTVGGIIINSIAGAENARDWDEFMETVEASNARGEQIGRDLLGVGTGEVPAEDWAAQVLQQSGRPDEFTLSGIRDWMQNDVLPAWQNTPRIDPDWFQPPSAIEGAYGLSGALLAAGEQYLDPNAAMGRYQELFDPISQGFAELPGQVEAGQQELMDFYAGLRGQLAAGTGALMGDYEGAIGRARGLVSELGEWERGDINRRWDEAAVEQQMEMSARGLGATGLATLGAGIERERTDDLLQLEEQIARQRLGVERDFVLPMLASQERLMGTGINLGGQQATAMQGMNQFWANLAQASLANRGAIAAGQYNAFGQSAIDYINNLMTAGGYPIETQMDAAQMMLDFWGPNMLMMPTPNQPATLYGYGGGS